MSLRGWILLLPLSLEKVLMVQVILENFHPTRNLMRRTTMSQQPNVVSKEGLVVQEVKYSGEGWENVQYKRNTKKSFVIWKRTLTDVPFFRLVIAMKIIRLPSY